MLIFSFWNDGTPDEKELRACARVIRHKRKKKFHKYYLCTLLNINHTEIPQIKTV